MGATSRSTIATRLCDRIAVGRLVYEHRPEGGQVHPADDTTTLFAPRGDPPQVLPTRTPIFGRGDLLATVQQAWSLGDSVVVQGRPGGGTSSVLRLLAHGPTTTEFPDGVVFIDGAGWRVDDLLQRVAEAFHRCRRPGIGRVLAPEETRSILADQRALVVIDHADLAPRHLGRLATSMPAGVVVLGTSVALDGPISTTLGLPGLSSVGGGELLARELARPLNAVQRADAERLIAGLNGRPLSLVQAAGRIRMERARFHDPPPTAEEVVRDLIDPDGGRSTRHVVAAALAAFWPTRLNHDGLAALLGSPPDLDDVLAELVSLGVTTGSEPGGFTVDPALIDRIAARFDLPSVRRVAAVRLAMWAETAERSEDALADLGPAAARSATWAIDAGQAAQVVALARAYDRPLATTRRWQLWGELLAHARHACTVGDVEPGDEAWVLHQTGTRLVALGDVAGGTPLLQRALEMRRAMGLDRAAAITEANLRTASQAQRTSPTRLAVAAVALIAAVTAIGMLVGRYAGPSVSDAVPVNDDAAAVTEPRIPGASEEVAAAVEGTSVAVTVGAIGTDAAPPSAAATAVGRAVQPIRRPRLQRAARRRASRSKGMAR